MKKVMFLIASLLTVFSVSTMANDDVHKFASNEDCKACHTQIYEEFSGSMHVHSTPQKDPIHKAVWDKHPAKNKKEQYGCGKCHTPAADNLDKMLNKGEKAMPVMSNKTHQEGISCAYCHRIEAIELHKKSNTNIISKKEKNYFGTKKKHINSPFHGIVTDGNEHMQNGNVCIGCHSHKKNKYGLNVCSTNIDNTLDKANCVSCHMPKVDGSVSNLNKTDKHTFHGFPGAHSNLDMLEKYVDIKVKKDSKGFKVNLQNHSSHSLLLHPLRLAVLKVSVISGEKTTKLKDETFARVIGKDGKPAMPWVADKTLRDNMLQANENRTLKYDHKLKKGDRVDVTLGWFLVNPKVLKPLKLKDVEVATKFNIFKKESFNF
ncbi:MAG: hypothetical protein GQ570_15460 [Helicobacteraceae bacterium]|nr:hypothetical protein [Helicobacteraceae bacterium]